MDNQNQTSTPPPNPTNPPMDIPIVGTSVASLNAASDRAKIAAKLTDAYNILVTVSNSPTVDQLAALIGLTLLLGKMKKHASAVFSGQVPSILEFLNPDKTIEKNTDSLQDFIIAIDKAKADKLRYKVEDNMVRIFITPYKTSITEKDLNFSLGDLNVDVIIALGVKKQEEIDQAIASHGKILHDATVISLTNTPELPTIGNLNWVDPTASSLSEMVALVANDIGGKDLIDSQIATAWLAGIVSNTKRFANDKTSPTSLSVSAQLLSSGANQQLVADKMEPPAPAPAPAPAPIQANLPAVNLNAAPGTNAPDVNMQPSLIKSQKKEAKVVDAQEKAALGELDIDHPEADEVLAEAEKVEKIQIDALGNLMKVGEESSDAPEGIVIPPPAAPVDNQPPVVANPLVPPVASIPKQPEHPALNIKNGYMSQPPSNSGNEHSGFEEKPSNGQQSHDNFMLKGQGGMSGAIAAPNIIPPPTIATASPPQLPPMPAPQQTNPASLAPPSPAVETARQAVNDLAQPTFQVPAAFNALPLGNILHTENNNVPAPTMTMPMPSNLVPPLTEPTSAPTSVSGSPLAPPPVPPPIINPTPPSF